MVTRRWFAVLAISALFVMACDVSGLVSRFVPQKELAGAQKEIAGAQETLQAIATTAPAVVASVIPTQVTGFATPKPAATTPPGASSSNPFTEALGKAKSATKYRVQFSLIAGGMNNGKYVEQPFMDLLGDVDGTKAHMTSKGGLLSMFAGDDKTPLEIIEADGKTYMKGMSLFGMADPKVWYISSDQSVSGFASLAKPDQYSSMFSGGNAGDYKKVRIESLDGQSCDVYLWDVKSMPNAAMLGMMGPAGNKNDFTAIDKGEMNFWLCKDGYVHQFIMDYEGHDAKDATQKAAFKVTWHAWDFNNNAISVTVPKDAKPMPVNK
jgi:hypothetical protein